MHTHLMNVLQCTLPPTPQARRRHATADAADTADDTADTADQLFSISAIHPTSEPWVLSHGRAGGCEMYRV